MAEFILTQGDMLLKIIENGEFKDVWIREGEVFLLPGNIPHSPNRFQDTIGLVIELPRPEGALGFFVLL
jgi:3-hydroxyanthranilate 3,4-dioxygenase